MLQGEGVFILRFLVHGMLNYNNMSVIAFLRLIAATTAFVVLQANIKIWVLTGDKQGKNNQLCF